jgi:protein subunit release factor A
MKMTAEFDLIDCRIDIYRDAGVSSKVAVRITHLPTGMVEIAEHRVSLLEARSDAVNKLEERVNAVC